MVEKYDAFLHCLLLLEGAKVKATPFRVIECLKHEKHLVNLASQSTDSNLQAWAKDFLSLKREDREQRTSGLVAQLQSFAVGETATLFNNENSDIWSVLLKTAKSFIVSCQLLKFRRLVKPREKLFSNVFRVPYLQDT